MAIGEHIRERKTRSIDRKIRTRSIDRKIRTRSIDTFGNVRLQRVRRAFGTDHEADSYPPFRNSWNGHCCGAWQRLSPKLSDEVTRLGFLGWSRWER